MDKGKGQKWRGYFVWCSRTGKEEEGERGGMRKGDSGKEIKE